MLLPEAETITDWKIVCLCY